MNGTKSDRNMAQPNYDQPELNHPGAGHAAPLVSRTSAALEPVTSLEKAIDRLHELKGYQREHINRLEGLGRRLAGPIPMAELDDMPNVNNDLCKMDQLHELLNQLGIQHSETHSAIARLEELL